MKKLVTLTALAGLMAGAATAQTSFIANSFYEGSVPMSGEGYIQWADLVEDLSDGDLVPEVFTGTVLLSPRAALQGIQDNEYAMGYFGYAYYNSNPDLVKALSIDGGDGCTEPNLDNAKDGSYPMARPLFIYANEQSLQREEVYEYVEFYLENAETDAVKDIGYVPSSTDLRDSNLEKLDELAGN